MHQDWALPRETDALVLYSQKKGIWSYDLVIPGCKLVYLII